MAVELVDIEVTNDDRAGIYTPSRIAGRYYAQQDGATVRLAVAELVLGVPVYHTHLVFTAADALACASLLEKIGRAVEVEQQTIAGDE